MKLMHFIFILITTVALLGCQQTAQHNPIAPIKITNTLALIDQQNLGPKPSFSSAQALFTLSPAAQQHFFDYFNASSRRDVLGHKKVYNYLANKLHQFNYYSATYTAQQALDSNSGNCLSLAILTTAYAQLANITITYSEMTNAPVYSRQGQFEFESGHVVSQLHNPSFVPQNGIQYATKPTIVIDYFPSKENWQGDALSKDQFIAMYYRNLSADALAENKLSDAAWLAIESFHYAPNDLAGINLMAVIYRRMGQIQQAQTLYQHGLTIAEQNGRQNLHLLSNYLLLLNHQGKTQEAAKISALVEQANDPSPFRWLNLANDALMARQLKKAMRYFKKVTEKAHYLPYGYEGMAKVYYLQGRIRSAKEQLQLALARTHDQQNEKRYQAKLAALAAN